MGRPFSNDVFLQALEIHAKIIPIVIRNDA